MEGQEEPMAVAELSEEVMEQLRRSEKDIEEGRVRPIEELLEEL